jgi:hypothetical protein
VADNATYSEEQTATISGYIAKPLRKTSSCNREKRKGEETASRPI